MEKRGKIRLSIGIIILLLVTLSFYFVNVSGNNSWIIEGNKVYVDNSNVYISAEPHTINENGYVYLNLNSKVYSGDVDLVLGFDTVKVHPAKAELYEPEWIEQTNSYACDFTNSYFNYTLSPKHFWCYINKTASGNGTGLSLVYERDFEWVAEKTAYWNKSYLQEWKDISGVWNEADYDYEGMNKWYYKSNIPIQSNINHQFRVLVNIDRNGFSPASIDTKYWFAIKPSSETLQQSIANAHFYALDPWVNSTGDNQNKDYLDTGLLAYWNFSNTVGTYPYGKFNLSYTGAITNVTGIIGGGINMANGASNYVNGAQNLTSEFNFSGGKSLSINAWIKLTSTCTSGCNIYPVSIWRPTLSVQSFNYADDASGGTTVWYIGDVSNQDYVSRVGIKIPQNTWVMMTVTYNRTTISAYYNGTLYGTKYNNGITVNDFSYGLFKMIGNQGGTSVLMDEVGIWNRTLNALEVSDLYNNGLGISYSPLPSDIIPPETSIPTITPIGPKTTDNLQCNATLTDNMQTSLIANWTWYINNISYLSGIKTNIQNGTPTIITTLEAGNTSKGEEWKCEVTPFDGYNYGEPKNSTSVTILNTPPTHSQPMLTSPSGKNLSTENLTCYNQSTSDADSDIVTNIYNWYKNNQPFSVLNMLFEVNAKDYSGNNNHGTIYGAIFTDGKVGNALSFDGTDDYVNTVDINKAEGTNALTTEAWIKPRARASGVINPMIIAKYFAWNLHINYNNNGFVFSFNDGSGWATDSVTYSSQLTQNTWYHVVGRYDGSTCKIFVNGDEVASASCNGTITTNTNAVKIGQWANSEWFNGSIDEVKIYPYALTPEQIKRKYEETKDGLTSSSKIVEQETAAGENYMCQVTPNDGEADGMTLNSSIAEIFWAITFDVRDSYSDSSLDYVTISCNYSGFNQAGDATNPYGPYGFPPGNWGCNFATEGYYGKTTTFSADNDTIIYVKLSREKQLTIEEHTWLEAIYNCVVLGDCSLYNMLLEMNQTVGNIWEHTKPTDNSVIIFENITNKLIDSTHNLTIYYTVNIPIKAGYSLGTYLPVRIGYWFLDTANTTCYNQGDKPTGVEDPYCQPLIIETIGPMGGSVNFTVKLHPSLPVGNYSIKRIIDIDPNNVWINYGQELISTFIMAESLTTYGISVEKTGETEPQKEGLSQGIKSKITGAVIGVGQLLSGWQIVTIVAILGGVLVVFIISRTILKLKDGSIKKK